jgi:type IV/VI secretion system ImpK/VasF family protein
LSLFDVSRELFAYMVSFREAAPHANSPGMAKVRADLDSLFARMENIAKSNPVTSGGYGMIRYALVLFCDEVLTTSGWKHGAEWSENCLEKRYYDTQEAGQRFFKLALKLDEAPEDVAAIFYLCLALGYHGPYPPGDPKLQKLKEHLAQKLPAPQYELGRRSAPAAEPQAKDPNQDDEEPMGPSKKTGRIRYAAYAGVFCLAALLAVLAYWPGSGDDDLIPPADRMEQAANGAVKQGRPAEALKAKTGKVMAQTAMQAQAIPSPGQAAEPEKMLAKPTSPAVRIGPKPGGAASGGAPKTAMAKAKPVASGSSSKQPAKAKPGKPVSTPEKAKPLVAKPAQDTPPAQIKRDSQPVIAKPVAKSKPVAKPATEGAAQLLGNEFAAAGSTKTGRAKPKAVKAKPAAPKAHQAAKATRLAARADAKGQVYFLQIGTFNGTEHADKLVRRLKRMKLPALTVKKARTSGVGSWHVVVTGPYDTQEQAQSDKTRLAQKAKLQTIMRVKPRKDWP